MDNRRGHVPEPHAFAQHTPSELHIFAANLGTWLRAEIFTEETELFKNFSSERHIRSERWLVERNCFISFIEERENTGHRIFALKRQPWRWRKRLRRNDASADTGKGLIGKR